MNRRSGINLFLVSNTVLSQFITFGSIESNVKTEKVQFKIEILPNIAN